MSETAPAESAPEEEAGEAEPKRAWGRLLLLAALLIGLVLLGRATGITERLDLDEVRRLTEQAGGWGWLAFIVVFCLGELVHVPGLVFVGAGVAGWGWLIGGLLGYLGALASVCFTFVIVRSVGGRPLEGVQKPWVKKALDHLDRRPVLTVAGLRVVLILSPPLNYALALSGIKFRDYLLGSALGIVPPVVAFVALLELALIEL